jgi:VIT1/CCC1 family predicted Fe2+/Mn2+ transporter
MPLRPHIERHFTASESVRDVVIGMSDGLTVPFALAAGLSGAISATNIVVTAGMAEIIAGSIAMGLGGYLAAKGEAEHYTAELKREYWEVDNLRNREIKEVADVLEEYGVSPEISQEAALSMSRDKDKWVEFMMRFELGLEEPHPRRALISALTIAGSYVVGGLIPLAPYMLVPNVHTGLLWSCVCTLAALAVFGALKGRFSGVKPMRSLWQTVLIGGLAAAAAFGLASLFSKGA